MFYSSLKNSAKKFPHIWKLLRKFKDSLIILSRLKDVLMMMILFHIWPEQTYRFSTRKLLPAKKNRFSKESKPIIPFELLKSQSSKLPKMKEVNLVALGSSFNLNDINKLNGPIFLSHFWNPLEINNNGALICYDSDHIRKIDGLNRTRESQNFTVGEVDKKINDQQKKTLEELKKKNFTYIHSDRRILELIRKNGHNALAVKTYATDKEGNYILTGEKCEEPLKILMVEKMYKPPILPPFANWIPFGSLIPSICALSFFAEKINVYGWDFYMDSSPEKMNYWSVFFNMYKFKLDLKRSKNHFESALINFYYGYHFSRLPNVNIHGYMGQLDKHEKLIKKIERVLFN